MCSVYPAVKALSCFLEISALNYRLFVFDNSRVHFWAQRQYSGSSDRNARMAVDQKSKPQKIPGPKINP